MNPLDPQEFPASTRRPMDFEDAVDILRRHKSWILGPALAALVLSVVVAFLWPDTYVSVATIRVVPRARKTDSAEVYIGEESIGLISEDKEDGETSYDFHMAILDIDLED